MKNEISPGLKTLFMVHFVLGLIFGLINLLLPELWIIFGWPVKDPVPFRLVGAAILGFAAGSWWGYKSTTWEQVRIIVMTELVWPTLGALVMLVAFVFNQIPAVALINALVLGGFAVAFYVYYTQHETPAPVVSTPLPKPVVKPAVKAATRAAARKPARPARKRRRT